MRHSSFTPAAPSGTSGDRDDPVTAGWRNAGLLEKTRRRMGGCPQDLGQPPILLLVENRPKGLREAHAQPQRRELPPRLSQRLSPSVPSTA